MWQSDQNTTPRSSYRVEQDKTTVRGVWKSSLHDYMSEWVKRKENEILQHQTSSLYIHFIYHPWIIPHVPIYHTNILHGSYTRPTQLLINNTTPYHPTSQHLKTFPYQNISYCRHNTTSPAPHPHLSQSLPFCNIDFLILFSSISQSITHNLTSDRIPRLSWRSLKNIFQRSGLHAISLLDYRHLL